MPHDLRSGGIKNKQRAINLQKMIESQNPHNMRTGTYVKDLLKSLEKCRRSCADKELLTSAQTPADIRQSNNQCFQFENLVKKISKFEGISNEHLKTRCVR